MRRDRQRGWTFMELIIVTVILGILSVYAITKSYTMGETTLYAQARKMAGDIRHAQALAMAWSKSLQVTISAGTNGSYSVSCVSGSTGVCATNPVVDPGTGLSFSNTLTENVVLGGCTTFNFNSLGQPSAANTCTLTTPGTTNTASVVIYAISGYVTVQ